MKNLIFNIYKTLFFFDLSLVIMSFVPNIKAKNPAYSLLLQEAVFLIIILAFTLIFTKLIERKKIAIPIHKHKVKQIFKGLLWGILIIVPAVLIMSLLKAFSISGSNKVTQLIIWTVAILLTTVTRELLLRGYLYRLYRKYYSFATVIIVNTLLFISLNLKIFNNKIYALNMLAMNVLLCMILEYSRSVLVPIATHFAYNWISTVMLGSMKFKNDYPFLFNCTFKGNRYISGGAMKIEGSICLLAVELIFIAVIIIKFNKKSKTKYSKSRKNYYGR